MLRHPCHSPAHETNRRPLLASPADANACYLSRPIQSSKRMARIQARWFSSCAGRRSSSCWTYRWIALALTWWWPASAAALAEGLLSTSSLDLLLISGILVCQRSESLPSWFHV